MTYILKYKKVGSLFWKKLKIKADLWAENRIRVFILEDESRLEVPSDGHLFLFDRGRYLTILKDAEEAVGQKIPVKE